MIVGLSGGPDSVFLLHKAAAEWDAVVAAHWNHATRGMESEKDQRFSEEIARTLGVRFVSGSASTKSPGMSEARMRRSRRAFLQSVRKEIGADSLLLAHTADDQVETVLMRVFEGAGIAGLKGIPRKTKDGIERPILDVWREDILKYLKKHKIPYRVDGSNFDTRFERNWIRHVLIPLLEKRYGKSVKRRIFALGERFREIDRYLEEAARRWVGRNIRREKVSTSTRVDGRAGESYLFSRRRYGILPSELRIRILQILCFEKAKTTPNERLLASMDRLLQDGKPSARLNVGKGAILQCRYDQALFTIAPRGRPGGRIAEAGRNTGRKGSKPKRVETVMEGPGKYPVSEMPMGVGGGGKERFREIVWKEGKRSTPARLRTMCRGEMAAVFDSGAVATPLSVRPLRAGDRIRPFGMDGEKKVKEILIDRKVPREERWGRPVVCDAKGAILWIPGVVRSAHAPVTSGTAHTVMLSIAPRNA
ncbi:MAG: tRNA lysidine(34) synthetase TilS [Deltaproteobacteria bacterium]